MEKVKELFKFRDNEKFIKFRKIFTIVVLLYFLSIYILIYLQRSSSELIFSLIPLFFLVSFFRKNDPLFLLAEIITIGADAVLILYHIDAIGFPIYILVQLTYGAYFYFRDTNKKRAYIIILIRLILSILVTIICKLILKDGYRHNMATAIVYYINLLINIACAIIFKDKLLIIGFTLFAISDLVIGFNMILPQDNPFRKFLNSFNFIHIFYLPSQVVLMFNKHNNEYKRKQETIC